MLTKVFNGVVNMSLAASVVAIFVVLIRFLFKNRLPKIFSYSLWSIVIIRLLIPFYFTAVFSIFNVMPAPEITTIGDSTQAVGIIRYIPENMDAVSVGENIEPHKGKTQTSNYQAEVVDSGYNYTSSQDVEPAKAKKGVMFFAAIIWASGVISLLTISMIMYLRTVRRLKTAVLYKDTNILEETGKMLKLKRKVRIFCSDEINSPIVCGLIKPKIILPFSLVKENNLLALKHIITHELIHIKRFDYLIKPLSVIALCLHWFNPIIWVSFILFQKDLEMSCDERVLAVNDKDIRSDYATSLINLSVRQNSYLNAGLLAFGEKSIKSRIKGIMNYRKSGFWMVALSALVVAILGVVLLTNPYGRDAVGKALDNAAKSPMDNVNDNNNGMEIYLVAGNNQKYLGEVEDLNSLELEKEPLISREDIVSYNWDKHCLKIKDNKRISKELLQRSFVVITDGERKYLGAFWSAAFSMVPPKIPIYLDSLAEERGYLFLSLGSWRVGGEIEQVAVDVLSDLHIKETLNRDGKIFKPYIPKNFPLPQNIFISHKEGKSGNIDLDWEEQNELVKSLDARFANALSFADYEFIPEEDNRMRDEETIITLYYEDNVRFKYNIGGKETEIIFNEIMMPVTGKHDDLVYFRGIGNYEGFDYDYKHGYIGYVCAPIGKLEKYKGVDRWLAYLPEEEPVEIKRPEGIHLVYDDKDGISRYYEFDKEEVRRIEEAEKKGKKINASKGDSLPRFFNIMLNFDLKGNKWYRFCDDRQTLLYNGQYYSNPALVELILQIAKEKCDFEVFDTSAFSGIIRAKYSFRTRTRTYESVIEDKLILEEIEEELKKAEHSERGQCPFDGILTLDFSDGRTMNIKMASDDCSGMIVEGNVLLYSKKLHEIFVNNFDNFPYVIGW